MSTPSTRAHSLRGGLVGVCSALVTSLAHAAAGGGIPSGSALVVMLIVCATVGAGAGLVDIEGRHARATLTVAGLCAGQGLGHLVLTAVGGGHHHADAATSAPIPMLLVHAVAAVVLGLLIGAAEYLFVVCSSILSWLRLFATDAPVPAVTTARRYSPVIVVQPVLPRAGLGMRAPPRLA